MWSRLGSRGLAIALGVAAVLLISPTPVPRQAVDTWNAARLAAHAGNPQPAEQALSELQLSSAWLAALKGDRIRLALAGQNGDSALALLETPPAPQAPPAKVACWRVEALALLGRWEQAADGLSSMGAASCTTPMPVLRALAAQELASGDLPTATAILQRVASLYPQDVETASLLGACLVLEDPGDALTALQFPAAQGDPLAVDLFAALGNLPPGDSSAALAGSGQVFLRHALWPLAAEAFRQLATLEPADASAHAYYGLALDQQGLDGVADIETAARLDARSATAQSLLGLHWELKGQPQKAIPYLELAVGLDPENSAFLASLAAARAEAGDIQAAFADYHQAAEIQPANPVFWRLLAAFSIARELELTVTGLPAARNAVVLDPEDAAGSDLLGYAHFLLGDRATAERLLIRSVQLDPASAPARLHYGLLLSSAGRTSEARAQLTAAASLGGTSPTGQFAERALGQLGD
jgi:Flp pilus assembly protein TadD